MKKKLIISIACLAVVVVINFILPRIMPGDPVLMLTGQDEASLTEEARLEYEKKLGLDLPVRIQFANYIKQLSRGDLGFSYHNNRRVADLLKTRIPYTITLLLPAVVLSSIIGAVFGCVVGYKKYSRMDNYITTGFIAINAVPIFFLAMVMVTIFSFKLDIFPLGGLSSVRVPNTFWGAVLDRIWHLILPVATITLVSIPMKFLVVRNSVAAAKDEKYVVYAKSRGVSDWRIKFIHIFKNVSQPFITIVGLNLGFAISGSMITEVIFSINGMGSLIYDAAIFRDYPTLQGSFLVISVMVILANILTDLLCIMIDPRQREGTYDEN